MKKLKKLADKLCFATLTQGILHELLFSCQATVEEHWKFARCISKAAVNSNGKHIVEYGRVLEVERVQHKYNRLGGGKFSHIKHLNIHASDELSFYSESPGNENLLAYGGHCSRTTYQGTGYHFLKDFEPATQKDYEEYQVLSETWKQRGVIKNRQSILDKINNFDY